MRHLFLAEEVMELPHEKDARARSEIYFTPICDGVVFNGEMLMTNEDNQLSCVTKVDHLMRYGAAA